MPMPYLIISELTRKVYIDERRNSYLFRNEGEAYAFSADVAGTGVMECEAPGKHIFSECFSAGAKVLKERSGDKEIIHTIKEEMLVRRYYNNNLSASIARYMHTKNMEYIRAMKICSFIVPVRIINSPYASIRYPVVFSPGKASYAFIAFTDLEEYGKWKRKQGEAEWISEEKDYVWMPMLIDCSALVRLSREHGVVLDLFGAGMYLGKKMIAEYLDGTNDNPKDKHQHS